MYATNDLIRIKADYQDAGESSTVYKIVEWNTDRGYISPVRWNAGTFVPQQLVRAEMIQPLMRPVRFCFSTDPTYDGYTDDSTWNGWLNVEVDKSVFDQIIADFRESYGEDFDESMAEIEPNKHGRYDFSCCYCTMEDEDEVAK